MSEKIVYQFNQSGLYICQTTADESPLEPGVFLMPGNSTEVAPPKEWPDDLWPRYNGVNWDLIPKPKVPEPISPEQKLAEFLQSNPDVLRLIEKDPIL
ncbi:phage tail protein [Acinetobacter calcoaceticus]|uniref:phage tail protein n=1 Tax=Acinetobacter calcoaceticus TaxID=471 RepID=UPI001AE563B0|nr:phage tail protein [Acinetobacter calcoaceticus]MBP2605520.1 hypothetical protein [Acinetobacter calcoaceticus]